MRFEQVIKPIVYEGVKARHRGSMIGLPTPPAKALRVIDSCQSVGDMILPRPYVSYSPAGDLGGVHMVLSAIVLTGFDADAASVAEGERVIFDKAASGNQVPEVTVQGARPAIHPSQATVRPFRAIPCTILQYYAVSICRRLSGGALVTKGKIRGYFSAAALIALLLFLDTAYANPIGRDFAPSTSPDGATVVYYSYRGDPGTLPDLYSVDVATGRERQLTNTPGLFEIEPAWSPDGTRIMFAAGPTMKELALYSVKPDGSDYQLFYEGDGTGAPNWSPDGKHMVFWYSDEDNGSELLVVDFETSQSTLLETGLGGKNTSPAWSPDGTKIAFSHRDLDDSGRESKTARGTDGLYIMDIASGAVAKLSPQPIIAYSLNWGPDGTLYFVSPDDQGTTHIYRISETGGAISQVSAQENAPAYFPEISRDGKILLFAGRTNDGSSRILSLAVGTAGESAKPLTRTFAH